MARAVRVAPGHAGDHDVNTIAGASPQLVSRRAKRGTLDAKKQCTCRDCVRCLHLITFYGQIPGNKLSLLICPHRSHVSDGFDLRLLLRTKSLFTIYLTFRYVQYIMLFLGIVMIGSAYWYNLPKEMMTIPSAFCAVVAVRPHLSDMHVNVEDWELELDMTCVRLWEANGRSRAKRWS